MEEDQEAKFDTGNAAGPSPRCGYRTELDRGVP